MQSIRRVIFAMAWWIARMGDEPSRGFYRLTGFQLFSPQAEFSPWETEFDHAWDQCKSVEEKNACVCWGKNAFPLLKNFLDILEELSVQKCQKSLSFEGLHPLDPCPGLCSICDRCRGRTFQPIQPLPSWNPDSTWAMLNKMYLAPPLWRFFLFPFFFFDIGRILNFLSHLGPFFIKKKCEVITFLNFWHWLV